MVIIAGARFYWDNLRGVGPAILGPEEDIADLLDNTEGREDLEPTDRETHGDPVGFPLALPDGFSISIFAKNLPGARVMKLDARGNMWVSQTRQGQVSLLEVEDGKVVSQNAVFRGLNNPHGLAFDPDDENTLYIAEEHRVSRTRVYSDASLEKMADLPDGGGHFTRTLLFKGDELLISVGSSCNVCYEQDSRRAKVLIANKDGSNLRDFAVGLRNSVFLATNPFTGGVWATEMGRDLLGDNVPPDEINILREGGDYGWPICYGKNTHDTNFDRNTYVRNPCEEPDALPSHVDLQAHSAPLGLAFVPDSGDWPEEWRGDLLVAYHGSWNRSIPTGYKLVRIRLDNLGNPEGIEDFVTGWLQGGRALGRPVDVLITDDGVMYVSDDHAGVIYKIIYEGR